MSTFQSEIISMDCKNGCLQLKTANGYAVIGIGRVDVVVHTLVCISYTIH